MDLFANLALGLSEALTPQTLLYCFIGVFAGTLIGVLPGIGALAAVSMLMPLTFHVEPTAAIVMLAGIFYGVQYGGSTASILLNLPGTPATAVTCLEGYPMTRKGRAGVALFIATVASFIGGCIGILIISGLAPAIARWALAFGPAEYFAMMLLGLVAAATISQGSALKGVAMVVLGLLLGTVGTDVNSGQQRFTFGYWELADGFSLVAIAMGLFGLSEVIASIRSNLGGHSFRQKVSLRSMIPTRDDVSRAGAPVARGTSIGAFLGALPGTGTTIASFIAYALEKRLSRSPERFGKGAVEGLAAPESANNAAAQTAFIPTLSLGIPGDAVMALILGALIIHGITPGPALISDNAPLFWGLIMSFWIGNVLLLILNLPLIGIWVRFLQIPYRVLYPMILLFVCVGVYSVNNSTFDIGLVVGFGLLGYLMRLYGYEPAPLMVAFVLGPLMEEHLRRALLLSRGDPMVFVERPLSALFIAAAIGLLLLPLIARWRRSRRAES